MSYSNVIDERLVLTLFCAATFKIAGARGAAAVPPISYFNSYHSWAEHNQFLVDLQASFPSNSELFTVGTSVEGRTIRGIRLWGTAKGKKAVVWHGTVHAREWLVAPVSLFVP